MMEETNNLKIDITNLEEILLASQVAIHEIISIQQYASQNREATTTSLEADTHRVSSISFTLILINLLDGRGSMRDGQDAPSTEKITYLSTFTSISHCKRVDLQANYI